MPSIFPGMDPFIEASGVWPGFHQHFLAICREQLIARLPANYDADLEEREELVDQGDRSKSSYRPDVAIRRHSESDLIAEPTALLDDLEPVTLHTPNVETESVGYIEIRNLSSARLVTVIELLSPTNKTEPDRLSYRSKMQHFRREGIHVVEIDLLLAGMRLPTLEPLPAGDFFAFVGRKEGYPGCEVYAWSVRRKLPRIPIPLNQPDADAALDLHEAFASTFDRGGYVRRVRYDRELPATLDAADQQWARGVIGK